MPQWHGGAVERVCSTKAVPVSSSLAQTPTRAYLVPFAHAYARLSIIPKSSLRLVGSQCYRYPSAIVDPSGCG